MNGLSPYCMDCLSKTAHDDLKWSGKTGQRANMCPTIKLGYTNDEETQFFR